LNASRGAGFSGPNPISYSEIKAWVDLTDQDLSAKDVEVIKMLDGVYMKVANSGR